MIVFGGILLGIGTFIGVDGYTIISSVEASGPIGQAAFFDEYRQAITNLKLGTLAAAVGTVFIALGLVAEIQKTLWKIEEQQ